MDNARENAANEMATTGEPPKQFCRIQVVFPANDDREAIETKRKIGEAIAGIQHAQITFTLATVPYGNPIG